MSEKNFILKCNWQSKTGLQEELYLGYNENNKLDCVSDLKRAKKMTQEECEDFKVILANSKAWVIDTVIEEEIEVTQEENANE
jgi:hypothetical protein